MSISPLTLATQGLLAPLAALAIATGGVLAGAQPAPLELPPPDLAAVVVERREAPVEAQPARAAAPVAERRAAASQATPARLAAISTGIRSAVVSDAPTRRCVVPAAVQRCIVAEQPARTCAVPITRRTTSVAEIPARSVVVPFAPRTARVRQRGAIVARFAIYQGNTGNFDVQLLSGGTPVNLDGATLAATWKHEDGTTGTMTFATLVAATGWARHAFTAGESAGFATGLYRAHVTVTKGGSVETFPGPGVPPIEFAIEAAP